MKHLMLIALFATSAYAESRVAVTWGEPEPREQKALVRLDGIEDGAVERASLWLTSDATSIRAELTLRLTTNRAEPTDLHMPLLVPAGTQLTDLAVAIGTQDTIPSQFLAASEALERYEAIVSRAQDPGLLRWIASGEQRARHELRVFPITRKTPGSVTIKMTLPRRASVVFDPGPHRLAQLDVNVDGTSKRFTTVTLPRTLAIAPSTERPSWMTADPAQRLFVDKEVSLFVGFSSPAAPTIHHRDPVRPLVKLSPQVLPIRATVDHLRERKSALENCYAYGRELDPMLLPFVDVGIQLFANGNVSAVVVSGDMDHDVVRSCIADEIKTWRFRAADRPRLVRESIDLRFPD